MSVTEKALCALSLPQPLFCFASLQLVFVAFVDAVHDAVAGTFEILKFVRYVHEIS